MTFGTWNVRTLLDIASNNDRPERRTALVAAELKRYNLDVVAISETRLSGEGSLCENGGGYTFFWRGYPEGVPRQHGVGFAIRNGLLPAVSELPIAINERLMTLKIPLNDNASATLISAYAPTLDSPEEDKDAFYDALEAVLRSVPDTERIILMGDFNARVGRSADAWNGTIGRHGMGKMNQNGLRLLTLCSEFNLCITNTVFQQKNLYKGTWRHPRSKTWHILDYVIVRKTDLAEVLQTRVFRGAECWTDHRLVKSKLRMSLRRPQRRTPGTKRLNIKALSDLEVKESFQESIQSTILDLPLPQEETLDQTWGDFVARVSDVASSLLGTAPRKSHDWFDESSGEIHELLKKKNESHQRYLSIPTRQSYARWKELRSETQRRLRDLQNNWWLRKAQEIQGFADSNNLHEFYDAVKAAFGPTKRTTAPIRSADGTTLFKNKEDILSRWAEYYKGLLNKFNPTDPEVLEELPRLPSVPELDLEPTLPEVHKAIEKMKNRKSPGPDGIPAEIYKYGGPSISAYLHSLLVSCWRARKIPAQWKESCIVTIYKNKGDKSECGNYRGISLLDVAGKVLTRVMLSRLLKHFADTILPESQCGFRADRSTIDMVFVARLLLEKAREQQMPMSFAFYDLVKAFDTVNRDLLWGIMERFGCPPAFLTILRQFHTGTIAKVSSQGIKSDSFEVKVGVKQGCVLGPVLFNIFLTAVTLLSRRNLQPEDGVRIRYRTDASLFNLRRLKARSRTSTASLFELQYADDSATPAHGHECLQSSACVFHQAYARVGLEVSMKKTETLHYHPQGSVPPPLHLGPDALKSTESFPHLGSIVSSSCNISDEICHRIASASSSFGRLRRRVFTNRDLKNGTKVAVYRAVCVSTLLYGCEAWTVYRKHIKTLEAFHIKRLQVILGLTWEDRVPHTEILQRAGCTSIECILQQRQLRWVGHVIRMPDSRLPKQVLYGELVEGHRPVGGPKKRFRDHIKQSLTKFDIPPPQLEELAADRIAWRSRIKTGAALFEARRNEWMEERRRRRHRPPRELAPGEGHICPTCGRLCLSRIGLHSHQRAHGRRRNAIVDNDGPT